MFFIPYEKIEIYTELSPAEVYDKLLSVVETQKFWASPLSTTKKYFGEVKESSFDMRRVPWSGRVILPEIVGNVFADRSGCNVSMRVQLYWLELVLYLLISGLFGFVALAYLNEDFLVANSRWLNHDFALLVLALISFGFVYMLLLIPVKVEAARSKAFFLELFAGKLNIDVEK
jgi:hypothetical protein